MRQVLCPVLIGRREELGVVDDALASARDGRGGVLVVSGEAGIGKSRLAREVAERAAALGMHTLLGRAVHGSDRAAYRPLSEALRSVLRVRGFPDAPELEPFRAALGRLVPEWAGPAVADVPGIVPEAVLRLLRALSWTQGLVLILEDLHWADADTLSVVEQIADALASERILLVATERSEWPGPAAEILSSLAARRAAVRVRLDPLGEDEVEQMTRAALEAESVPAAVLGALRRRAEGVPFLIEEMLSAYLAAGGEPGRASEWWAARRIADALPPSYRELVRVRLDALDADARRAVASAAVLGRSFDWRLLAAMTGLEGEAVLGALRAAAGEQLVWGAADDRGATFSFRHALAREAVLAGMLPPELADLSGRAAEALEDAYPGLPGEWCERAGSLRLQAGDRLGAARLLQESGRRALARGALATAEAALVEAAHLAEGDWMAWLGADELLFDVLAAAGKTERLLELGRRVTDSLGRYLTPSRDALMRRRQAMLNARCARGALLGGEVAIARTHLDVARNLLPEGAEQDAARLDALEAHLALAEGSASLATERAAAAASAAERLGSADLLCEALDAAGRAAFRSGDLDGAARAFERVEEAARRADLIVRRTNALAELGAIDRLARADPTRLLEARALATRTGAVSTLARIDLELAWNHLGLGEVARAGDALSLAVDTCRRFALRLLPHALVAEAALHALAGDEAAVERSAREAIEHGGGDPDVEAGVRGAGRGVLLLGRGERAQALDEIAAAAAILASAPAAGPWWFEGLAALLRVLDGRSATALRPAASADPANLAYLGWARAVEHGRAGRAAEAEDECARADERMPAGWRRHHTRALVAEAAAAGGWGSPGAWAAEALAYFEGAGLPGFAGHAKAVMRRAGVPVPRRGRGTAEVPEALRPLGVTAREMDVLLLVALGLSNDEIGGRLYLSPRTVETHVASLQRKTGCETRPQLVAFAARHASTPG